jgi:EAL domain-containing protein (putative c-di-GMP-specific phosphodiesterase class I)
MQERVTVPSPYTPADIPAVEVPRDGRTTHQLTTQDIDIVYQPIVDMATGWTVAFEALTRCKWPEFKNPVDLFSRAQAEGSVGRLGRVVRDVAFTRCDDAPLFVNIHPYELNEEWLVRPDDPIFFHDRAVYLEVTESAAFNYFETCVSVLREITARGGGYLVVDDLGAGYSNLKRVLDLEPNIIKLDIALVRGIEKSRRQQILVRQVVALCLELGADVVAEGIETVEELKAIRDTGAQYGQGYLFAKPSYPAPRSSWPLERAAEPSSGRLARELSSGKIRL